jgi:hypothetical protein
VLSQNATHANTKAARANRRRPTGHLIPGTPVIFRVDESITIKFHHCQESLTAIRMATITRGKTPFLYVAEHSSIRFKVRCKLFPRVDGHAALAVEQQHVIAPGIGVLHAGRSNWHSRKTRLVTGGFSLMIFSKYMTLFGLSMSKPDRPSTRTNGRA